MEEILASIRRIIAEDQAAPQNPPVPPLTASLRLAEPTPVAVAPTAQVTPLPQRESPRQADAFPHPAEEAPSLVSTATATAVGGAFERLAATPVPPPLRSLEEAVSEMLRPMLKSWLDDNLPTLVERLVKAEIERLTRAAR